jgi:amino acid adenylation domain-containing protein
MKPESELSKRIAALSPAKRATLIQRLQEKGEASGRDHIPRRNSQEPAALSFAQERLWLLAVLEPESRAYNLGKAYHLNGPLNVEALQGSLEEILRRHEALRTTFASEEGNPVQVIAPHRPLDLPIVDLTATPREQRFEAAMKLAEEEFRSSFDLTTGPLMRATLLHLDEHEHVLILTLHHIVFDGWSGDVLDRELSAFYGAISDGRAPGWPDLPIQYADYAVWQRQQLAGRQLENRLAFWRKQLAGAPALDLLTDRPRPPHQTYRGARYFFTLSPELAAKLEKFNRQENVTPFMSLLAAFGVLLFRRSGQADFMVGTPVANRPNVELEELIGFFVNSLVMRADLSGEPSFRELVSRVRRAALDAYQHQDLPFERLVEELNPEREMSRHPLFQVMFALQNAPQEALTLAGLEVSRKFLPSSSTRFDLELHFFRDGDGWSGSLVYSRDLFEEETIEGMVRQYVALLEEMLAEPACPVSRVPMMPGCERERILVEWNATGVDYPRDRSIDQLFEEQAKRTPRAVAVVFGEQELTYGELDLRSGELAHYLGSLGVRAGARVGICIEPSIEMIVGLLGILKAGAAYVPIDPKYPEERISFMLADTEAAVLLTRKGLESRFSGDGVKAVYLDTGWEPIEAAGHGSTRESCTPEDIAYVIFTSGSTGTPKGVCVPHRGVSRLVVNCDYVQLCPEDVVAQVSNCCFDAATFEIWGALLNGSRLVGIELEHLLSPESFSAELARHRVTTLFLTTALFNELVNKRPEIFGSVRNVLFGGEECEPRAVKKVLESGPPQRLLHVYGPTETTTFATWYQVTAEQSCARRIPIGRPIANTQVYLLDSHLNPVPIGVGGEICIGGEGVASGYLKRPELTEERFIPSPFVSGQRLYRTGDLGRFLPDGNIEFLGRLDDQVKIRGFRIELGEIECVLRQHSSVAATIVIVREDSSGYKQLVAYFVGTSSDCPPKAGELREFLRGKLPEYMVPSAFVVLGKLPLTPNGKIDQNALPLPDYMVPSHFARRSDSPLTAHGKVDREALLGSILKSNSGQDVAASTTEDRLRALCRKTIGASPAALEDSLIEIGLHSLSAANLAWSIHEEFHTSLRLSEVLENPTLGNLLARIERGTRSTEAISRPRIGDLATRPDFLPVSFPQEQVWFLEKLHPHLNSYRFQALFHCRGELDVEVLEAALNRMVARHEILRTAFVAGEGESPRQEIRPHVPFRLVVENLESLPAESRQKEIDRLISEELCRQFDLAKPPLIRWRLFRLDGRYHKLLHTEHHFLHDGWGYGEFLRELYATYLALLEGKDLASEPPPIQFADFAIWQREMLKTGAWDDQLEFWRKELAECPAPPSLPSDRRITGVRTFAGLQIRRRLSEALWEELGRACSRDGVTRFAWIHAAFQLFIHRYTGAEDFCIGSGFANRRDPRLHAMLGMVINTFPVRARFGGIRSFRDLAKSASHSLRAVSDNQELPFERVVQELNPSRGADANPFFNTFIGSYENAFPGFQSEKLEITSDDGIVCGQVKFDIVALLVPRQGGAASSTLPGRPPVPLLLWEFSSELFEFETAERMLGHFLQLLESSVRDPDASIRSLPMVPSDQERRLITLGKAPSPELPGLPIHRLFEATAASRLDAPAVIWDGGSLTYGELSKRSGKLARYLRDQGVEDGARVALCMDRSPEMIVGMLGILKAGGTYVPLDPDYPEERLRFMVEDASAAAILTLAEAREALPQSHAKVIVIDRDWPLIEACGSDVVSGSGSGDTAYVIFTSGSTGTPKGVAIPHRAATRLVINTNYVELGPMERIAHLSNVCFDAATFEIWGALLNGAGVVIIPKTVALDPPKFGEELKRHQVSTLFLTTALFNELARENGRIFQSLNQVLFGGETVNPHWVRHVMECGPPKRLLHVYGPTECTTFATFYPVTHVEKDAATIPIGRPISNTTSYVLDSDGKPVPVGVPGELYLGGEGLALGYINQPELTRDIFVANPFVDTGNQLYRTGDLARYLPDGNIEFIGRIDGQVKIRGFRIEPGEIEAILKRHPGLEDAVVVAREEEPGERRLVAYLVPRSDGRTSDWGGFLRRKLPDYMMPSAFVLLDKLPLTLNGKIDRRALPAPERQIETYRAPRSPQEQILCEIFAEVLKLERVGIDDNFFALGGHSLLAMQLVNRMRENLRAELDVEIPLRTVFENPTVAGISELIQNITWAAGAVQTDRSPGQGEEMVF